MNKGFFSEESVSSPSSFLKPSRGKKKSVLLSCESCGLYRHCKSPKMEPTGNGGKGIFILAMCPGEEEDKQGEQLVGSSGKLLRRYLKARGIDLDEDCVKYSAVNCRPMDKNGNNRDPDDHELDCCRPKVWETIRKHNPKHIWLFGGEAVKSFLEHRWHDNSVGGITRWRGLVIPDRETRAWVACIYHPSFILRGKENGPDATIFGQDLDLAVSALRKPFPQFEDDASRIEIIEDPAEVEKRLKAIQRRKPLLSHDYETTGKKPQKEGHKIVCIGVSTVLGDFVFFLSEDMMRVVGPLWRGVLSDSDIPKTAHHMKFEHNWSRHIFGVETRGWRICTMLASHVEDNRRGFSGLKFQVYRHFGLADYSSDIRSFLESIDSRDGNSFNRVFQAPREKLLKYCGMDARFGRKLAEIYSGMAR